MSFSTKEVTPDKVNLVIKSLDANKAPSKKDKVPMKLVILASNFLSKPISKALNNFITSCTFEELKKRLDNNYVVGRVLIDLSEAFNCVPHDLLIAKREANGINENLLAYLHSCLSNRKQCVCINNVTSDFKTIISELHKAPL